MLAFTSRIFVGSDIGVWPPVECALADASEVVRHKLVAERVALLDRGPELVAVGVPMQADRISRACRVQLVSAAVGIVATDRGADRRLARVYVGGRADADVHL